MKLGEMWPIELGHLSIVYGGLGLTLNSQTSYAVDACDVMVAHYGYAVGVWYAISVHNAIDLSCAIAV